MHNPTRRVPLLLVMALASACDTALMHARDAGPLDGELESGAESHPYGIPEDHFPLTPEAILDRSTLDLEILSDRRVESAAVPGRFHRLVSVRYFSHVWHDGPWYGAMAVLIPDGVAHPDTVAFAPAGSIHVEPGFDFGRDLFDRTAVELGIVVATLPSEGMHFGRDEIHDISDYLVCQAIERSDPAWAPEFTYMALQARAATAVSALTGSPVTRAFHHGSSITAGHSWRLPLHDPRYVALSATGNIGYAEGAFPEGTMADLPPQIIERLENGGCDVEAVLRGDPPGPFETTVGAWFDAYDFGSELTAGVMMIAGTNDPWVPPSLVPDFMAAIAGPTHVSFVPNYGHGTATTRHAELYRMWIDHIAFGRPVNEVRRFDASIAAGRLSASAVLAGDAALREVTLWYSQATDENHIVHAARSDSPSPNYTEAVWTSVPMREEAGGWVASVDLPVAIDLAAVFVDARDEVDGRSGYTSSAMRIVGN